MQRFYGYLVQSKKRRFHMEKSVNAATGAVRRFLREESGEINMVAIVLIILIVIVLAAIFRDNLRTLLETLFRKIQQDVMTL